MTENVGTMAKPKAAGGQVKNENGLEPSMPLGARTAKVGRKPMIESTIMVKKGKRLVETPLRDVIVSRIKQGAFAWVAAVSAGISQDTYFRWMREGKADVDAVDARNVEHDAKGEPREEYGVLGKFHIDVKRASAHSRRIAEVKVLKDNPLAYLRFGPGRERPGEPGWTDSSKVELTGKEGSPLHPNGSAQRLDLSKYTASELDLLERLIAKGATEEDGEPK
jgi:hypothetical protein